MTQILVVDDSPTEIHVLKTILEKNGYTVLVA
ncbi:MAG TPA: response regulator, partial [Thioalkalivibrio sp.]|nr:response regulator [Thioalkalivibrio sp.]